MSREFAQFWDELEPVVSCNWTTMVKRLIIAGKGISIFSKIAFIEELQRGDVVWRPLDVPELNALQGRHPGPEPPCPAACHPDLRRAAGAPAQAARGRGRDAVNRSRPRSFTRETCGKFDEDSDLHDNLIAGEWKKAASYSPNINPSNLADVIGRIRAGRRRPCRCGRRRRHRRLPGLVAPAASRRAATRSTRSAPRSWRARRARHPAGA